MIHSQTFMNCFMTSPPATKMKPSPFGKGGSRGIFFDARQKSPLAPLFQRGNLIFTVKSPISALRFILRHCGVPKSTPHGQNLRALILNRRNAGTLPSNVLTFYEFIKTGSIALFSTFFLIRGLLLPWKDRTNQPFLLFRSLNLKVLPSGGWIG